jgi:hypothetical protein
MKEYKINWKTNITNKTNNFYKLNWNLIHMEGGWLVNQNGNWVENGQQPLGPLPNPPPQYPSPQYPSPQYPPQQYSPQQQPQQYSSPQPSSTVIVQQPAPQPTQPTINFDERFSSIEKLIKDNNINLQNQIYHIVDIQILNEKINSILKNKIVSGEIPPQDDDDPELKKKYDIYRQYKKDAENIKTLKLIRHSRQYALLDYLKEKEKEKDILTLTVKELSTIIRDNYSELEKILKKPEITREKESEESDNSNNSNNSDEKKNKKI